MKNIQLISASAGSGKTYRLMNEIADRVAGDDGKSSVAPEEIMATTFTNKAAAELKERIRMRLLEAGRAADAQRIYDGLIGTVNSICARLLKEYAFEAGLSPAVDVLPEEDAERIFNMATSSAIEGASKELEPIARRLGLMGYGSGRSKQADWRKFVQDIVNLARSNDMDANHLKASADQSWQALEVLLGKAHSKKIGQGIENRLAEEVDAAIAGIEAGEDKTKDTNSVLNFLQNLKRTQQRSWEYVSWSDWLTMATLKTGAKSRELVEGIQAQAEQHLKHPRFRADMKQMIEGVFTCAAHALSMYSDYKREQGLMDFVDQEALVLRMARNNASFQASIRERVKLLMVDEFQDTSPIQLALFLKLSELAEDVVWVGDQKQAIYGFRGTDPVLMDAVAAKIEQLSGASSDNVLKDSWRSKRELVNFCNAIFTPVFHHMGEDKVRLNIPKQRESIADGGWLESWTLEGSNQDKRTGALVTGIQEMIKERNIKAGDIAVLSRSNDECSKLSEALHAVGIRASIAQGDLLATHECTLALAGLRYMVDQSDSIAMAEIVCYAAHHKNHAGWMQMLMNAPEKSYKIWAEDPLMQQLVAAGEKGILLTPLESLELAMAAADVERMIYAWGNVSQRLSNLDQLRAACETYQDRCKSRRGAATVTGFLTWLYSEAELQQAEGTGPDTVKLLTYHRSKGLEWPVVVMASLNKASRHGVFGVSVHAAENFHVDDPLAGRSIRFWPWPYGSKKKADGMSACTDGSEIALDAEDRTLRESQRLLYVGMARARDGLVLIREKAKRNVSNNWLDALTGADGHAVMHFEDDETVFMSPSTSDSEAQSFSVTSRILSNPETIETTSMHDISYYAPVLAVDDRVYPTASQSPSGVGWEEIRETDVQTTLLSTLGDRLPMHGAPDMADFGNAMHGFFGADVTDDKSTRLDMANRMLTGWEVEGAIDPAHMLIASDRLKQFIGDHYPNVRVLREWPMAMELSNHQRMHGWIDMLLELPEGYIIIDHKSYPGSDAVDHAKEYAPQLNTYKQAVEQATGKSVLATLIHMPIQGAVVQVSWHG